MDDETRKEIKRIVNKDKGFKAQEVIILVLITCIFSFFAGNATSRMNAINDKKVEGIKYEDMSEDLVEFVKNYQNIINNYYEPVDEGELLREALKTITEMLDDPYSMFMNEAEYNSLNISLEGSYRGLGIAIYKEKEDEDIIVSHVFEGSPADKGGIQEGDIIKSINGTKTATMTTSEFSQMVLNSDEDRFVLVTVREKEEKTITLTKASIVIQSVSSEIYEENGKKIGYIYISIFANNTYKQFKSALDELEKEKIDSLIIDVRSNTGGYLSAVSTMISLFIDSKHIAYQLEQNGVKTPVYSKGAKNKSYPIIFLADRYSASASEVFIASLKDNLNAKVIGEKTFGKGTVQELVTLSSGDQYKITTKKWLSPKGAWVNDTKGIAPDIEISLPDEYYKNPTFENDTQLRRAIEELSK